MQNKHILHAVGVVALSLLCACGGSESSEGKKDQVAANDVATTQVADQAATTQQVAANDAATTQVVDQAATTQQAAGTVTAQAPTDAAQQPATDAKA